MSLGFLVGVQGVGSDHVGHRGVGDLLVEYAGLFGCVGVRGVVELVGLGEVGLVIDADNPFSVCHLNHLMNVIGWGWRLLSLI